MRRVNDAMIQQAIAILRTYHEGEFRDAMAAVEQAWGRFVGKSTLCDVFRRAGLAQPSTFLLPRRTAAQRLASTGAPDVPPPRRVGDLRGSVDGDRAWVGQAGVSVDNGSVDNMSVDWRNSNDSADVQPKYADRHNAIGAAISGVAQRVQQGGSEQQPNPRSDPSLHVPTAPKGYHLRGVSTLTDGAGNVSQQWIKTTVDRDALDLEALFDAIQKFPDAWKTHHEPVKVPDRTAADLLAVYPVADPHLGMYAWAAETGANYDVATAERLHVQAIKSLVAGAPPAKQALVCSLGDFLHCDSNAARTERSGNPLDVDTRFAHVLQVGIRTFCAMIDSALEKHERVRVICEIGNHDQQASAMLAMAMDLYYRRDERVSVDLSPARFHYHRFGKCLFGTTHGSDAKADKLPMVMARDRAADWGQTEHRKWLVGHYHQERVQCFPGCKVEFYRTLAGQDAWAHGNGYRSDRGMSLEVYHREHGFVGSSYVGLNQLEAA